MNTHAIVTLKCKCQIQEELSAHCLLQFREQITTNETLLQYWILSVVITYTHYVDKIRDESLRNMIICCISRSLGFFHVITASPWWNRQMLFSCITEVKGAVYWLYNTRKWMDGFAYQYSIPPWRVARFHFAGCPKRISINTTGLPSAKK